MPTTTDLFAEWNGKQFIDALRVQHLLKFDELQLSTACYTPTMGDGHGGEIGACELGLGCLEPCNEHSRCGVRGARGTECKPSPAPFFFYPLFNYANV